MAHHQALILLSINNLVNDNILQKRFMENPEIQAVDILLQERMPRDMLITKDKKEKTKKIKYTGYDNYIENSYTKVDTVLRKANITSSEDYMIYVDDRGQGFSKYKDILINKYKETADTEQGIIFYVKNTRTNTTWKANYAHEDKENSKYEVVFSEDKTKITKSINDIETEVKIIAGESSGVEIRSIRIRNNSKAQENLEVISTFEPCLSRKEDDIAHPAFNNLFLKYSKSENGDLIIKRNKRGSSREMYLGCNLILENSENQDLEYEIDRFYPLVKLKKSFKLNPGEDVTLNLIISISEQLDTINENLSYYKIQENVRTEFETSRAKAEEEARYLSLSRDNLNMCQRLIPYVIYQNPMKAMYMGELLNREFKQSDFWKYRNFW